MHPITLKGIISYGRATGKELKEDKSRTVIKREIKTVVVEVINSPRSCGYGINVLRTLFALHFRAPYG